METVKIVWHDPDIHNSENSFYTEILPFTYDLKAFSEAEETIRFLQSENNPWILVTSGRKGEELVSHVCDNPNVIGIIIFCKNKKKHQEWTHMYPKVEKIETQGFENVLDHASKIFSTRVMKSAFDLSENSTGIKILNNAVDPSGTLNQSSSPDYYHHMQSELEMSFLMVIRLALKIKKVDRDKVLAEFLSLNPSNEVKNAFKAGKKDLIKSIVYLYSTNMVFFMLNQCYARNEYHKVMNVTAALMFALKARAASFMLNEETALYRGANLTEVQINDYEIGKSGFWSAFTSTSKNEAVSRNDDFGGNVQFEIYLSGIRPHPHIVIPAGWSMVTSENEVLLLPYFPFKVEAIHKDLTDNYNTYTKIVVRQDENHPSLALDSEVLLNYWLEKI
ncbi:unnamed protein product [Blepharisma stoltei]|uniref:NAD(P)(+)--arginine ADP-ribosyltransferase n=1 Tax=Blepharisma stoltei TaxID=1481888 RepID=A0AAU9K8U5_9CILI|nr:unnamed protein product [Blepharisma stoltei]